MQKVVLLFLILMIFPFLWLRASRPAREAVHQPLQAGAVYDRVVFEEPPIVAHVVEIDLAQTAVSFQVTPSEQGLFAPIKTSTFLHRFGSDIAINGSFYQEDRRDGSLRPLGLVIADGEQVVNGRFSYPTFCALTNRQMIISNRSECPQGTVQGIAGNVLAVENGEPLNPSFVRFPGRGNAFRPEPRTAVALNEDGSKLWFVVVDGRQPNYSVGMTMAELASFLVELGAYNALNLDGGGSSTLVTQSWRGPIIRNSPIHNAIPTLQRPVPTHLGIQMIERQGVVNAE